jgi:hypothetical protein
MVMNMNMAWKADSRGSLAMPLILFDGTTCGPLRLELDHASLASQCH